MRRHAPPLLFISLLIFLLTNKCFAQAAPAVMYAESFRQGATHIAADRLDIRLTPQDATYRQRIKDAQGTDRYLFTIAPLGPEGDTEITAWQVKLSDLQHPRYDNLLLPSNNSGDESNIALSRLDPSRFSSVPIGVRRIIKVDGFYVVLGVKAHHFTPADSPYLDSMALTVDFTNEDPRTLDQSGKAGSQAK